MFCQTPDVGRFRHWSLAGSALGAAGSALDVSLVGSVMDARITWIRVSSRTESALNVPRGGECVT